MDPEVLRMLSILGRPLTNQVEYSRRMIQSPDEYVRIAGIAALLEFAALPREHWDLAVSEARHGAVAGRAFRFFVASFDYERAKRVASAFAPLDKPLASEEMQAVLGADSRRLVDISARKFLNDAKVEHLMAAAEHAEAASGWREAIIWLARATVIQPIVPAGAYRLLRVLETANQFDSIEELLAIFEKGGVFSEVRSIFKSVLLLQRKDPKGALESLSKLRVSDIRGGPTIQARLCQLRAQAHEALGQYRDAWKWYQEFNKQGVVPGLDKRAYLATVERLSRIDYPLPSDDQRAGHVMMLGFPRSGTTLLEHALSAHPEIETFEEIPSLTRMIVEIERTVERASAGDAERRSGFEQARRHYYDEIDRRKAKPGARVFVDKLPIRTAWIRVLEKFFPEQRYIFSIRHPYDVVLSCFKQYFTPNSAMENFRTLEDACEFYDRVMSIWFGVFPAENERVLYIRYDELVTDFENQVRRALAFLNVGWSDEVRRFAELSDARKVGTPSYGKVRSGLGIGIQSSWQNYRFAFDTPHGKKLQKWVDRFGYER